MERTRQAPEPGPLPDWLRKSWESAKQAGLDRLSMEEIDAEIAAARKERHEKAEHRIVTR